MNNGARTDTNRIELEGRLLADPARFGEGEGSYLVRCVIVTDVPSAGRALHQLQFRGDRQVDAASRFSKGMRVRVWGRLAYDLYEIEGTPYPLAVVLVEDILHPPVLAVD